MSEEEIIKRLKNIIELNKIFIDCSIQENSNIYKDIQGLLDLYQQEKEKNKELEKKYNDMINCNNELLKQNTNAISKDKIKEEIKKLNEKNGIAIDMYNGRIVKTEEDYKIAILKKLLRSK